MSKLKNGKFKIIITILLFCILLMLCLNLKTKIMEGNDDRSKRIATKQKKMVDDSTLSKKEIEAKYDPSSVRNRFV